MAWLRTLVRAAREHLDSPYGRFLLLLSCALVFLFAFHAKTAVYRNPSHIDGSTSSKLWLSGSKPDSDISAPADLAFWTLALLLLLLAPAMERHGQSLRRSPVPVRRNRTYLERFFRPPPTR
jgi:hypothetical protein